MTYLIMTVLAKNRQIKSVIKLGAKVTGFDLTRRLNNILHSKL